MDTLCQTLLEGAIFAVSNFSRSYSAEFCKRVKFNQDFFLIPERWYYSQDSNYCFIENLLEELQFCNQKLEYRDRDTGI